MFLKDFNLNIFNILRQDPSHKVVEVVIVLIFR
jgi:hypothetical protein